MNTKRFGELQIRRAENGVILLSGLDQDAVQCIDSFVFTNFNEFVEHLKEVVVDQNDQLNKGE